jgi:glycosyltransferase involved in cell wall biosynthesis
MKIARLQRNRHLIDLAMPESVIISFCITTRNRLWQLRETLAANLATLIAADAAPDRPDDAGQHNLVLVDYGSTDETAAWVWEQFSGAISTGQLTFFEVTNPVAWHMSRAKNLAHRLARGSYCFNLDGDNFIQPDDIRLIEDVARQNRACHQASSDRSDGSSGRIGLPADLFMILGGYDESMLPMSAQDIDLLRRIRRSGRTVIELPPPHRLAVQNTQHEKLFECAPLGEDPYATYEVMKTINRQLALARQAIEGPCRSGGFASFQGRLNGKPIVIDGFNTLHPVT